MCKSRRVVVKQIWRRSNVEDPEGCLEEVKNFGRRSRKLNMSR
jgi:hypothetical protein